MTLEHLVLTKFLPQISGGLELALKPTDACKNYTDHVGAS